MSIIETTYKTNPSPVEHIVLEGWLHFAEVEDFGELAIWHQVNSGHPERTSHLSLDDARKLHTALGLLIVQIEES